MGRDIILLSHVIKSISYNQTEIHKDIDLLKDVRNQLAHPATLEIPDHEFNQLWKKIADILVKYGASAKELEALKKKSLEEEKPQSKKEPNVNEINTKRATVLKDLGNADFKKGDYLKAIERYTEATHLSFYIPTNDLAVLYSNRSVAYLKLGDSSNAKKDAKGAIHLRPVWFKGYYRLANAYMAVNKFEFALQNFNIALSLEPNSAEVKNDLAHCKYVLGKLARDEHLDPMNYAETFEEIAEYSKKTFNSTSTAEQLQASVKFNNMLGLDAGICGEAHNYRFGRGVPLDYERAAHLYAKAASRGNAEGMFNLAQLTMEGKGVQRNMAEGIRLLEQAASQDIAVDYHGHGLKMINIGVGEAEHALGLKYDEGVFVEQDFKKAIYWYERAIKHGVAASANNMAIMYNTGKGVIPCLRTAIHYWKLSASKKLARGAENLAITYYYLLTYLPTCSYWTKKTLGRVMRSLSNIAASIEQRKAEFEWLIGKNFDKKYAVTTEAYEAELYKEVREGPLKHLIDDNLPTIENLATKLEELKNARKPKPMSTLKNTSSKDFAPMSVYRIEMIKIHRQDIKELNSRAQNRKHEANPAQQKPKQLIDLIGLKPITLREMNTAEDKIYEGFAIKLTIIEDAGLRGKGASISLIGQDENGDAQRIYIYNFPQNKETQDCIGFGCKFTIVNPYFRQTMDGQTAIRVDDSSLLILHPHLTDKKRCRYCGIEKNASVTYRKCKRCFYCSKLCLQKDSEELCHEFVCKKNIL